MLDNYNNSSPTRSSRTAYRPPLNLPKSPLSPGNGASGNGIPNSVDLNRIGNGRETRSPAKIGTLNGSGECRAYANNGDRNGGDSSPDAVDAGIRRRVELLEKASCKNLSYNINRASRSPKDGKLDENNEESGNALRSHPIRNFSTAQSKEINYLMNEKEIITLDAESSEKGSPIPVMKLLNPEFRAMLGKTTKISPNKQFATEFRSPGLSPLSKGRNDNNGEKFRGMNGSKNINLKTILTHETSANGGTQATPNKVVNINVIVSKNVNSKNVNNLIEDDSNDEMLTETNGQEDLLNCRNNNVQRHRELIENNINASINLASENSVHRIRNDLERNSMNGDSRANSKERDVLVKQINMPFSNIKENNVKDNIEKSEIERSERVQSNVPINNSKDHSVIQPSVASTQIDNTIITKDRIAPAVNNSKDHDDVHSKDKPNELDIANPLDDIDDAYNGNLIETNRSNQQIDVKKKLCQTFIENEQAFESLTSVEPENLTRFNKADDAPSNVVCEIKDINVEPIPAAFVVTEISTSNSGVPQVSTVCPIPISKTDSNEQIVKVLDIEEPAKLFEDSTDSVSIATKSQVKDGVYYKQLLNVQRDMLAQFLSTFESILSDHERSKAAGDDFSCTDSASMTLDGTANSTPCDISSQNGTPSNISPELEGQILLTVGKCKLLLNKKFPFFDKNCDKSLLQARQPVDPESEELQILNEDLTGLWDTICIQIDEVREKFEKLSRLRDNNWVALPSDSLDASPYASNGAPRSHIPKIKSSSGAKRTSFGNEKKSIPRGGSSKSTSALSSLKSAKIEERKKFLEEKRKAMMAERRKELKKQEEESGETSGDGLVQFL